MILDSVEKMLMECCRLRGNPPELINRTIHEFDWFLGCLIWKPSNIIDNKLFPIRDDELIKKIYNWEYDGYNTLYRAVSLFYEYCKVIYPE
jgi:hypothetical protein